MIEDYTYLYVEDDLLSREALQLVLKRVIGVKQLHVFEDSTDFMARVQALPDTPDLIMLDIHMKPHDGFEMLAMLRREPAFQNVRVIALTASVMNEEVQLLKQSGFNGAIGKPIDVANFRSLIEQVFQGDEVWHVTGL